MHLSYDYAMLVSIEWRWFYHAHSVMLLTMSLLKLIVFIQHDGNVICCALFEESPIEMHVSACKYDIIIR